MSTFPANWTPAPVWTTVPYPQGSTAIEITQQELVQIEGLLRTAWRYVQDRDSSTAAGDPLPAMLKAWNKRIGAEAAVADAERRPPSGTIPFYENEIDTVEKAAAIVEARTCGGDETNAPTRRLLAVLHQRLGYAQASAFRPALPPTGAPVRPPFPPPPVV